MLWYAPLVFLHPEAAFYMWAIPFAYGAHLLEDLKPKGWKKAAMIGTWLIYACKGNRMSRRNSTLWLGANGIFATLLGVFPVILI